MSVPSVVFARAAYQEVDPKKSYEQGIFSLHVYFLGNMPVDDIFSGWNPLHIFFYRLNITDYIL